MDLQYLLTTISDPRDLKETWKKQHLVQLTYLSALRIRVEIIPSLTLKEAACHVVAQVKCSSQSLIISYYERAGVQLLDMRFYRLDGPFQSLIGASLGTR